MRLALVLSLSYLLVGRSHAQECNSSSLTIELPVRNVTITNSDIVRWGIGLGVGTPPQTIAAVPSPDWNNTAIYPQSAFKCKKTTPPLNCSWYRGGGFNDADSSSWEPTTRTDVYEFRYGGAGPQGNSPWGNDTVELKPDVTIPDVSLYSPSAGEGRENNLGLGRASSFLDLLVAQGKIASRTWSLFWGWQGLEASQQMEGHLVLGGYDKAKTKGGNYTGGFGDNTECATSLSIDIKRIHVDTSTGTETDIFNGRGRTLNACIRPDYELIALPPDVWQKFNASLPGKNLGESNGIFANGISAPAEDIFKGDLTFTLTSGLTVTIPNHQLVLPNVEINKNGDHEIIDDTRVIPIHNSGDYPIPTLGQTFLSAAYLYVNNDRREFTLWQANPTKDTDIVGIGGDDAACSTDGGPEGVEGAEDEGSASMSTGALAGIVVGAVAGVVLIALGIFFLVRRKQNQGDARAKSHVLAYLGASEEGKKRIPEMDAGSIVNATLLSTTNSPRGSVLGPAPVPSKNQHFLAELPANETFGQVIGRGRG
ncbi:hypothetical protein FQN55_002681 [Onygenales sp. PD_40]|nr:hypothetical protein FQN55_002681 [Onygenales sp. PD_40]KAK2793327.1 hypothetical protein FQN52_001464 [Onygenales sp. PD_12]